MSKSTTKSSSTSNTATNSTTTPTVAPWLNTSYQGLNDLIGNYAKTDPSSYVAGTNSNLDSAFNGTGTLGAGNQYMDKAAQMLGGGGQVSYSGTSQGDIDRFLNPYLSNVVDTTLADYDVDSGRTRAAQQAQAAKNQAFGGSRYALREAQTEGELARGRATTDAGLRSSAYDKALSAAQQEAAMRLQAGMASAQNGISSASSLGALGASRNSDARNDLTTTYGLGVGQRDIANEQANALPDWLKNLSSMYGSIPIGSFTSINEQGTGTGSTTGKTTESSISIKDVQKAAQMAAMMSDIRLKENIEYSDTDEVGRNWYTYNYIWDAPEKRRRGVMAQELLEVQPDAVIMSDDGFLMVDYGSLR